MCIELKGPENIFSNQLLTFSNGSFMNTQLSAKVGSIVVFFGKVHLEKSDVIYVLAPIRSQIYLYSSHPHSPEEAD